MNVSVTSSIEKVGPSACESIRTLMANTLSRFTSRIAQVSVLLVDENGPRGGADKVCRVNLLMPGVGTVSTTARHEKVMAAASEAARRARRVVVAKLKRPQALRTRRRTKVMESIDAETTPLDE